MSLSAFGILAVYVAGTQDQQAYAANQALGFALGLAGAIPLVDYRLWQRYLRPIYDVVETSRLSTFAW